MEDKENENEKEKDNFNNPYFVYLIDAHNQSRNFEIALADSYGLKSLNMELLEQKEFLYTAQFKYIYKVYRIMIIQKDIQFGVSIQYKEDGKNNNIYKRIITNEDIIKSTSNVFLYNFQNIDKTHNNCFSKNSMDEFPLSVSDQFKIYLNILKEKYNINRTSKKSQDCIKYIMEILKHIQYEFCFYITVFAACFDTSNCNQLLKLFKTDKTLIQLGEFNNEDLTYYKDIINSIIQKPNLVLETINDEERASARISLYAIILIFDLKFQKEKLKLIYWNENLLCSIFYQYYHFIKFFDFNAIKEILSLIDDCYSIVYILNRTKDYLLEKFYEKKKIAEKKGEKVKDLIIQVDNYVIFKDEENKLDKILIFIESITEFQKEKNTSFISFSPNFFLTMTKLINEKNIEQLFIIKNIQNILKSKTFENSFNSSKIDIDKILDHILNKSIMNKDFSFFNSKCEPLINYLYKNDKYLDEYAIELIRRNEKNDEFLRNRKEKKRNHGKNFIKNACSAVTSLDQFDLLFKVLFEGKESKEFLQSSLTSIQKTFFLISKQYTNQTLMTYLDIISELIYKSNLNLESENIGNFLEEIEKNLNKDFIVNLYVNTLNKYQILSIDIKNKIYSYLGKLDPKYISILIRDLKENSFDFIKRDLLKYVIKEDEFFILEDSISIKILNSLISYGIFPKKDSKNMFLKETYNRIESIINRIKINDFTYNNISQFFLKENNQKFCERISLLYVVDNNKMINEFFYDNNNNSFITIQQLLENKYKEIKKYIDSLCIFRDYLSFLNIYNYINEFQEIIKLNYYFQNSKINQINKESILQIEKYEKEFGQKAREIIKFSKSLLFMDIKKKEAELNKDDEKILNETFRKFKQAKEIFNKDGFNSINKELLSIYLNIFKDKKENEIKDELKRIINLLNVKNIDNSIEDIVNTFFLFSKKDIVIKAAEAVKNFIDQTEAIQKEYTGTIKSINNFRECSSNKDFLKMNIEILEALGIDIMNSENYFISILFILMERPEVIKFLLTRKVEECGILYDSIDNNEILNIIELEKCAEYMNSIGNIDEVKEMKDYELIEKAKSSNLVCKNLVLNFNNFIHHFDDIKKIFNEKFDKSEVSRKKIDFICQNSSFCLSSSQINYFKGKFYIKDEEEKDKTIVKYINLKEFKVLRDISILAINSTGKINKTKQFIDMVSDVLKLINLLNEIYYLGFTEIIRIKISTNNNIQTFSSKYLNEQSENVNTIIFKLKNDYINNLKINYEKGYKTKVFLRFIYGRIFNTIYDYCHNFNINIEKKISLFLKFITNNKLKNTNINYEWKIKKRDKIQNMIDNCNDFIEKVFKDNNLSLRQIYNKTLIEKKPILIEKEFKGLYLHFFPKIENAIIQLYIFLTKNIPKAQNILLCNLKTSNEEIESFLYRAILCEYNSCFIIGRIESLKFIQKKYFIKILNQILYEVDGKQHSCLIILCNDKNSDIYKNLNSNKYKKIFNSTIVQNLEKIKIDNLDKITIFTSDISGVGKSTKIENEIRNKSKRYIYFPVGGVFTGKEIMQRLKNLNIVKNTAIHLDLYDTDCIDLMIEFLFWILIGKLYKLNDEFFFFLEDTEIYIEIPNGFINFVEKYPILELIPQKHEKKLSINNLESLIVSRKIDSKIQIVCNFLKQFKENKIDDYELNFPGIIAEIIEDNSQTINAKLLSNNECQKLIFETFLENNIKVFNYYQIQIFLSVLADEFIKFNHNIYFSTITLVEKHLRSFIIDKLIKFSNFFTQGDYTKLINEEKKEDNILLNKYKEIENNKKGINYLSIDSSLLFFHEGNNQSFSYITNKGQSDKDYEILLSSINNHKTLYNIPDYNDEQIDFLQKLKLILGINNPLTNRNKESFEKIVNNFVFTSDNFIKMILILLRLRANIPVIIMGERGCGKKTLIQMLSEIKRIGSSYTMEILSIHEETTENDIISFIEEILPKANILEEIENENKRQRDKQKMLYEKKKLWVFLDEINTCKSMGLISELMLKHTYQGKPISSNIVFIGTCNPYREVNKKIERIGFEINQAYYNINKLDEKQIIQFNKRYLSKNNKLAYNVNPLPHSLLNFVYNFKSLNEKDEKKYISKIIEPTLIRVFEKCKASINTSEIKSLAEDMIFCSYQFIRDNYDISSVTLREIQNFNALFEFFYAYLKDKKEKFNHLIKNDNSLNFEYHKLEEFDLQKYAINLSIYICFYLRISDKNLRVKLVGKLNRIFKYRNFLDLPLFEMKFIIDNIDIPIGIAKNKSFSENIFSLFCAINARIPLFIIGKPGGSKSLSVQLILKSMKGSSSKNEFFKYFPKLVAFSFQGSLNNTSEEIEIIFNKANNSMNKFKAENKNNLSLIYIDEIGLSEHSPNNPLKAIYSQLEKDTKIAFIGISNWVIVFHKMNRGLYISIPELDEEDIIKTSKGIAESYNKELVSKFEMFFTQLGETYYKYRLYMKSNHYLDGKADFHGNRDFFYFIKYVSKMISKNIYSINKSDLPLIGLKSIERNFAGLKLGQKDSIKIVKDIFKEVCKSNNFEIKENNSIKNIKENIQEENSRYLLLFSNMSESCYLLSFILEDEDYIFFIGSQFIEDSNNEEYQLKVIKKIQICMEEGKTIILKDLEFVYPYLYNLFNQNFSLMNRKNFALISVGSSVSLYSQVNTKFKCVINVDINNLNKQEPPFLNRFEKHLLIYENLLNENLTEIAEEIFDNFNKIINNKKEFILDNYDFNKILINVDLKEIKGLIYKVSIYEKNEVKIIEEVLSKIALTLPQDIIFQIIYNKNIMYRDLILKYYSEGEHMNLEKFLKNMNKKNNIIYTFSKIFDKINIADNIINDNLNFIINSIDNIKIIIIGEIKSEKDFEKNIEEFYNEDKYKICLIHFSPEESNLINYTKFFIENKEKKYQSNSKIFILIVHISRIFNYELDQSKKNYTNCKEILNKKILKQTISHLSHYYQIFIDNLNGDKEVSLLLDKDKKFGNLFDLNNIMDDKIYSSLNFFKYNILYSYGQLNKDNYKDNLIRFIKKDKKFKSQINDYINNQLLEYQNSIKKTSKKGERKEFQIEVDENDIDMMSIHNLLNFNNFYDNIEKNYNH